MTGDVSILKQLLRGNPGLARSARLASTAPRCCITVRQNGVEGYWQKSPKNVEAIRVRRGARDGIFRGPRSPTGGRDGAAPTVQKSGPGFDTCLPQFPIGHFGSLPVDANRAPEGLRLVGWIPARSALLPVGPKRPDCDGRRQPGGGCTMPGGQRLIAYAQESCFQAAVRLVRDVQNSAGANGWMT